MDRNGKKPKAPRGEAELHAERSDTKASMRDTLGRASATDGGGKGAGSASDAPTGPGRKGRR